MISAHTASDAGAVNRWLPLLPLLPRVALRPIPAICPYELRRLLVVVVGRWWVAAGLPRIVFRTAAGRHTADRHRRSGRARADLTPGDERAYTTQAEAQRSKGFEDINVTFTPDNPGTPPDAARAHLGRHSATDVDPGNRFDPTDHRNRPQ